MNKRQLLNLDLLKVNAPQGGHYMGGAQVWFNDFRKRMSGCGPTTASGMLWYLARSRQNSALCETGKAEKSDFLKHMHKVFDHVTPGAMGVSSAAAFSAGIMRYGSSCGVRLQTRVLKIPAVRGMRPAPEAVRDFIIQSLGEDLPLAFLNLSNGSLANLDNWHWVMMIAFEPESMTATICDSGGTKDINLGEWLETTALGGGLVSIFL